MNRLAALSRAETLQFFRNPLLAWMAPWPIAMAVLVANIGGEQFGTTLAGAMFILLSMGFLIYYSALSMVTTRRDEKVLKRLRTGEARDWEIIAAIASSLAVLTVALGPVTVALVIWLSSAPTPSNVLYMVAAVLLAVSPSVGLALLTSRFTKNAEAAMVTSAPVLMLSMLSFPGGIRESLGQVSDQLETAVSWNPFALAADLFVEGWSGGVLDAPLTALAALAAWAVALTWLGFRFMRWDTHR